MLDYSQAFDSISHRMLLAKMPFYGFGVNAIEWVKSYIGGRSQVTKIENETSASLVRRRVLTHSHSSHTMPAPHPQTPRTDPPRPTVHGINVSVPPRTADLSQW
ncbi:hypothetical protein J6590_071841, partial [Homalodisca vitripennis]